MAIKKINRTQLTNKVEAAKIVPTEPAVEEKEVLEPEVTAESVNDYIEEQEDLNDEVESEEVEEDEVEEPVKPVVVTKPQTKKVINKPVTNKINNTNKGGNKMSEAAVKQERRVVGRGATKAKKVVTERTIGTVYPRDILEKDILAKLEFDMTLVDLREVIDAVEASIIEACQVASVRFLGGVVKAQDRNALVAKAPRVDYHSYTGERKVITITGGELGQPDKFRGYPNEDNTKFIANEVFNYETNEWEATNQEIDIAK